MGKFQEIPEHFLEGFALLFQAPVGWEHVENQSGVGRRDPED